MNFFTECLHFTRPNLQTKFLFSIPYFKGKQNLSNLFQSLTRGKTLIPDPCHVKIIYNLKDYSF